MIRHGSLESGIGMFDYAAEKVGWENVFHCEINKFCQTILKYYWPKTKSYADVFEFNGNDWRGKVDVITCGFPCQPFSHAGKREGSKDDRFIWPENLRIIREAKPPFVLAENVPGLLTIENGMVFEQVCLDLENEGYEVTPFVVPAVATDKDHRRDRVWIIAFNPNGYGDGFRNINRPSENKGSQEEAQGPENQRQRIWNQSGRNNSDDSNTTHIGLQGSFETNGSEGTKSNDQFFDGCSGKRHETWLEAATRLCSVVNGDSGRLAREAVLKATGAKSKKGSHFNRWRTQSLMAAGNTIVPDIAIKFFQAMEAFAQQQEMERCKNNPFYFYKNYYNKNN